MKFEWDLIKAESNRKKHGLTFEEAITAFDDPLAMIAPDSRHSSHEQRWSLIGEMDSGKIIIVVFTERQQKTRLISARPASRRERSSYAKLKRIPV